MTIIKPYQISKQLVWQAWLKVKSNAGSAGIDNETIELFERNLKKNLYKIWNRMSSGSYFPPSVKGVPIPKKSGGQRLLGIPTVSDRIAQTIVKMVLEPKLEKIFLADSFGYRPNKSAHDAIGATRARCWKYDWVLEFDIKGLFDNIDHDLLMKAVRKHTDNAWAILYIERWLKAPMELSDEESRPRERGTPQGGVISPLLANIFMHYVFDIWMQRKHSQNPWCRYADDGLVHCKSLEDAEKMKAVSNQRLKECGLEMHPEKTKIVYCRDSNRKRDYAETQFKFLGYDFKRRQAKNGKTGQKFDSFLPAMSVEAFLAIKKIIKQEWAFRKKVHLSLEDLAREVNPQIRGWINYYGKFYESSLSKLKNHIDRALVRWAGRKYGKLNHRKRRSYKWLDRVKSKVPNLFAHWNLRKAY